MTAEPIYRPSPEQVAGSQMSAFMRACLVGTGNSITNYAVLHAFALREPERFWNLLLQFAEFISEGAREPALEGAECETATFFPNLRLNYVENLLADRAGATADSGAITACDESGAVTRLTRGQLRDQVLRVAAGLRALGVEPGDRVVAVAANTADSIVAYLATIAVGATWSSIAPDVGTAAMLDRFRQLDPKLLFCHGRFRYQGTERSVTDRLVELRAGLPGLATVVQMDDEPLDLDGVAIHGLDDLRSHAPLETLPRFPFNQPMLILFSSGTTGQPKCIVHGAGGTLLEHYKELRLHTDLGPGDKIHFTTSAGWMMWNWLISALVCGAEIVLYDGSVSFPEPDTLWQCLAREGVTVFGTSPAYLAFCRESGITPRERVDLSALRAMASTGSILPDSLYFWVRDHVKADIPLQSISGGTDIVGCFVLGNPNLPVYPGESQCVSLGMDVRAVDDQGKPVPMGETGELICAGPFPSRPLGLYGDPDGARFHQAYFSDNPGVWTHGDFIRLTSSGGARILGRSDGVLNIRGIRIGPAEIYNALADMAEVRETMAVERIAPDAPGGSELVLLVVLRPGENLVRPLILRIKKLLSQRCSRNHVPQVIAQMEALPTTHSGKRSERAARDAVNGRPVVNAGALRNPETLRAISEHPALVRQ